MLLLIELIKVLYELHGNSKLTNKKNDSLTILPKDAILVGSFILYSQYSIRRLPCVSRPGGEVSINSSSHAKGATLRFYNLIPNTGGRADSVATMCSAGCF